MRFPQTVTLSFAIRHGLPLSSDPSAHAQERSISPSSYSCLPACLPRILSHSLPPSPLFRPSASALPWLAGLMANSLAVLTDAAHLMSDIASEWGGRVTEESSVRGEGE